MDAGKDEEIPFVEPPSQDYYCPVCYELLTHAYQTKCCGHHLCHDCNGRLQATPNVNCPMCQKPGVDTVEDKFFVRQVHSLRVHCYHHQAGCEWEGELRELSNHVSVTKRSCDYVFVKCVFSCGQDVRRRELKLHKREQCPKRPKTCEHCSYHNTYDVVTEKHYPICEQFPVECPNRCGMTSPTLAAKATTLAMRQMARRARRFETHKFKRKALEVHLQTVCPLQEIECKYAIAGCPVKLVRKLMDSHLQEATTTHIQLLEDALVASLKENAHLTQALQSSHGTDIELKPFTNSSEVVEQYLINLPPVSFTLDEYTQLKEKKDSWFSPPFYTYCGGHKLQLKVYANGWSFGTDTHLSIYVYVMRGENDDSLQWPLIAGVTLDLLSWNEDTDPHSATLYLPGDGYCQQVVDGERAAWGQSIAKFIPLSSLEQYLEDDCLRIRVSSISVHNIPTTSKVPSWQNASSLTQCLCEITLPEFSKCKAMDTLFYTPPFYTCERGYKFHLRIYTNGYGLGEGTHISVQAILMKGDFDDSLQWPFVHDISYELVNWREDQNHHMSGVSFGRGNSEACGQVLEGNVAKYGYCDCQSILHTTLPFDALKNTQYLEDDCLRIRVKEVIVYSTPSVHKVPFWHELALPSESVCELTLYDFSKRKQFNNIYCSTPFYIHPQGYKMQLNVWSNGFGSDQGSHVSVLAYLMKGQYDDTLQWPLYADIALEFVNWREDKMHNRGEIMFDFYKNETTCGRVLTGEKALTGCGTHSILHSTLSYNPTTNTQYLEDDCLCIRVKEVAVYSTPSVPKVPSWQDPALPSQSVCEFTLNEFAKRKQFNNRYYSTPFYTHPQGYKMQLNVYSNGEGSDQGSHVSVFVYLMKGQYDDTLQWPLCADIAVEFVNWQEDKMHNRDEIMFDIYKDETTCGRVLTGEKALIGRGRHSILQSTLSYNPTTNTQYLVDDCLRIRVKEVAVYSTPSVPKVPSWQDPSPSSQSVCEFTLTKFSKRKQFNNQYYSTPFYTHPQGYKMQLLVYSNGEGSRQGSHVSVYAYLMKGQYDNTLQWPFCADITIELLNWRVNQNHIKKSFCFPKTSGTRVIQGVLGENRGYRSFVAHSSLSYESVKNTEYIQNDCLRFRINVVVVHI